MPSLAASAEGGALTFSNRLGVRAGGGATVRGNSGPGRRCAWLPRDLVPASR